MRRALVVSVRTCLLARFKVKVNILARRCPDNTCARYGGAPRCKKSVGDGQRLVLRADAKKEEVGFKRFECAHDIVYVVPVCDNHEKDFH